ncbi:MAG TPA: hypothetical protein VK465_02320, partial [Fibrobacteria bacterium]|nr:hypothetical protein [Fibrobacteria bacterium]
STVWTRRDDICDNCTFASFGRLRGDNFGENKAMMPWAWDDSNDGPAYAGDMLCDPAVFFDTHLNGVGFDEGVSHKYVDHAYRTHTVEVTLIRSDRNLDSDTNGSDLYLKVTAPGSPEGTDDVINSNAWKVNNAKVGIWYEFGYGGFDAEGPIRFGERIKSHSFCRTGSPSVRFAVYDRDKGNPDDLMGTISSTEAIDLSQGIDLGDSRLRFKMIRW